MKLPLQFKRYKVDTQTENYKGASFCKNVIQVMVLIACNLSDHAIYLYQVLGKYLKVFQSY